MVIRCLIHRIIVALLAGMAALAGAEPTITINYDYYHIEGQTAAELREQMNLQGVEWTDGNTYDAYTGWDVSWNYRYRLTDDGCSMASVTTTVNVVFRMPRWTNYADASAALKEKWDAYIKSLRNHENGHKDIGVSAAFEIEQSLAALKPALTCSELAATANELGSRIISKYAEQERQYDIRTHFGKTQGAIFP